MALHLITGYAGQEHVTSADQGAYNIATFGSGEFVLDRGAKFSASVVSNNLIRISNGEAMMQGRYIKLALGTYEDVTIENGSSGQKRKDLIVIRYTKNITTGVETAELAVKKGTASSGTPSDPSYTHASITDGNATTNEMPLYRVNLDGLNISTIDTLFSVAVSMKTYMDNYQMAIATTSAVGAVKVPTGNGLSIDSAGSVSMKTASASEKGGVKINSGGGTSTAVNGGLYLDGADTLRLAPAGSTSANKGGVYVTSSSGLLTSTTSGELRVPTPITYGTGSKTSGSSSLTTGYIYCQYE